MIRRIAVVSILVLSIALMCTVSCKSPSKDKPKEEPEKKIEITSLEKTRMTQTEIDKAKKLVEKAAGKSISKTGKFFNDPSLVRQLQTWQIIVSDSHWSKDHFCGTWEIGKKYQQEKTIAIFIPGLLTGRCQADQILPSLMIERVFENRSKTKDESEAMPDYVRRGLINFYLGTYEKMLARELNSSYPILDIDKLMEEDGRRRTIRWALFGYCFDKIYGAKKRKKLIRLIYEGKQWKRAIEQIAGKAFDEINEDCDQCMTEKIETITKDSIDDYQIVFGAFKEKDYEKVIELGETFLKNHPQSPYKLHCSFDLGIANFRTKNYPKAKKYLEQIRTGALGPSYIYDDSAAAILYMLLEQKSCDEAQKTFEEYKRYYHSPRFQITQKWDQLYKETCAPKVD